MGKYFDTIDAHEAQTRQTAVSLHVLQRAVGVLIETHSDPAGFALRLRALTARIQVDQLLAGGAPQELRVLLASETEDLAGLAEDVAARRRPPSPP